MSDDKGYEHVRLWREAMTGLKNFMADHGQYYAGNWGKYPIDHDWIFDNYRRVDILFSGCVGKGNERRCMGDIFPNGFYNPDHYDKTHGVILKRSQMIDVWGVRNGKLFAKTMEGDYYFSSIISPYFNTCVDHMEFMKTADNSYWSNTIYDLMWFCYHEPLNYL